MVNAEFSRIYRFVKLLVNEGFLAVTVTLYALSSVKSLPTSPFTTVLYEKTSPSFSRVLTLISHLIILH